MANGSYGHESSGDGSPDWDESLSQRSMASGSGEFHDYPHFRNTCHTVLRIGPSRYGSEVLEVTSLGSNRSLADDDEEWSRILRRAFVVEITAVVSDKPRKEARRSVYTGTFSARHFCLTFK